MPKTITKTDQLREELLGFEGALSSAMLVNDNPNACPNAVIQIILDAIKKSPMLSSHVRREVLIDLVWEHDDSTRGTLVGV